MKNSKRTRSRQKSQGRKNAQSSIKKTAKQIAKLVGAQIGSGFGTIGQRLGSDLGGLAVDTLMGSGTYELKQNTLHHPSGVPVFRGTKQKRVSFRESLGYLKSHGTSGEFYNTQIKFNPANPQLGGWLENESLNWGKYEVKGFVLVYRPLSSNYTPQGNSLGEIILTSLSNADEKKYDEPNLMKKSPGAVYGRPDLPWIHYVECARKDRPLQELFVGMPGATDNDLFYYQFQLQMASFGVEEVDKILGELEIIYDVVFSEPRINPAGTGSTAVAHYRSVPEPLAASRPFMEGATEMAGSSSIYEIDPNGSNIRIHRSGLYMVNCHSFGFTFTGHTLPFSSKNATLVSFMDGGTSSREGGQSATHAHVTAFFDVDVAVGEEGYGSINAGSYLCGDTNASNGDVFIIQLPSNLTHVFADTKQNRESDRRRLDAVIARLTKQCERLSGMDKLLLVREEPDSKSSSQQQTGALGLQPSSSP
jgi:hypothetical protein